MLHIYQLILALVFIYIATMHDTEIISSKAEGVLIGMTGALCALAATSALSYYAGAQYNRSHTHYDL